MTQNRFTFIGHKATETDLTVYVSNAGSVTSSCLTSMPVETFLKSLARTAGQQVEVEITLIPHTEAAHARACITAGGVKHTAGGMDITQEKIAAVKAGLHALNQALFQPSVFAGQFSPGFAG